MSFYEGKKVLIAGGAGLIGQALIRALVPLGADVTATEFRARRIAREWRDAVRVINGLDLNRPKWASNDYWAAALKRTNLYDGFDIVFWAAAKVGGAKMIRENPMELVHYNLELAARNVQAAVEARVSRFCYLSSSYVYHETPIANIERDTGDFDVPIQHYGLGWIKRFMEKLCRAHHLTGSTEFALVRPAAIYGPYDNFDLETCHVIPALIRKVAEGQNPLEVWGDGSEERQFTFVDDLVEGLLIATERFGVAQPINIATPHVSTVNNVWQALFRITGVQPDWTNLVKYLGDRPRVVNRRVIDVSNCRNLLGYTCSTSLEDGLRKTLEWYRSQQ